MTIQQITERNKNKSEIKSYISEPHQALTAIDACYENEIEKLMKCGQDDDDPTFEMSNWSKADMLWSMDFLLLGVWGIRRGVIGGALRPRIRAFVSLESFIHISLSSCESWDHASGGNRVLLGGAGG